MKKIKSFLKKRNKRTDNGLLFDMVMALINSGKISENTALECIKKVKKPFIDKELPLKTRKKLIKKN